MTQDRAPTRDASEEPRLPRRPLGASGLDVSMLSLGSWRTYEQISREEALAVIRVARSIGINFLDDARYNDETGAAPIATGWSEVLFGELLRASGWRREEVHIANKLWWEFWPDQSASGELRESLRRTGIDAFDLVYAVGLAAGLSVERAAEEIAALMAAGACRHWGVANWTPDQLTEGTKAARALGIPPPCAVQLAYSLVYRDVVEDPAMEEAVADAGASIVASASLAGGALSGRYALSSAGRLEGDLGNPLYAPAFAAGERLAAIGRRIAASPAALAYAWCLRHRAVATVLFGATTPQQVEENATAIDLLTRVDEGTWAEIDALGTP